LPTLSQGSPHVRLAKGSARRPLAPGQAMNSPREKKGVMSRHWKDIVRSWRRRSVSSPTSRAGSDWPTHLEQGIIQEGRGCDGHICSLYCERVGKATTCSGASDEFAKGKERSYVASLEGYCAVRHLEQAATGRLTLSRGLSKKVVAVTDISAHYTDHIRSVNSRICGGRKSGGSHILEFTDRI
jgi:hypothetical protein